MVKMFTLNDFDSIENSSTVLSSFRVDEFFILTKMEELNVARSTCFCLRNEIQALKYRYFADLEGV